MWIIIPCKALKVAMSLANPAIAPCVMGGWIDCAWVAMAMAQLIGIVDSYLVRLHTASMPISGSVSLGIE